MASFIKILKDKLGNDIFPKTREKAVYDDNGVRLDNKINDFPKHFYKLHGGIEVVENSDLNNSIYRNYGTYYCENTAKANTILNLPEKGGFAMYVYAGNGTNYPVQDIIILGSRNRYSRYLEISSSTFSPWRKLLSSSDIIQSDTIGGVDKLPSAEVTKALGLEIDEINNNLAFEPWRNVTLLEGWTGSIRYTKNGFGQARLDVYLGTGSKVTTGTVIAKLPIEYRPNNIVAIPVLKGNISPFDTLLGMYITPSGDITIRSPLAGSIQPNVSDASITSEIIYYVR